MADPFGSTPPVSDSTGPLSSLPAPPPGEERALPNRPSDTYGTRRLTSIIGLATAAKALVIVGMVATVVDGVAALNLFATAGRFDRGAATYDELDTAMLAQGATDLLAIVAIVVAGIVTIVLLWKLNDNADQLTKFSLEHRSHWTLWGWVIPILNLVRPKQMVDQIWDASAAAGVDQTGRPITAWWWGFWVTSGLLGVVWPDGGLNPTIDQLRSAAIGNLVTTVTLVGAGVCFIMVITKLVERQRAAATARGFYLD